MMLVVSLSALVVGLAAVLVAARHAAPGSAARCAPEALSREEFQGLLTELVERLGLRVVDASHQGDDALALIARDPRQVAGGRLLVHGVCCLSRGRVGPEEVRRFAESVRADAGTLKGLYLSLVGFSEEARREAREASVAIELVDASGLLALLEAHLPERVARVRRFEGFATARPACPVSRVVSLRSEADAPR